jgi:hypothetical protein
LHALINFFCFLFGPKTSGTALRVIIPCNWCGISASISRVVLMFILEFIAIFLLGPEQSEPNEVILGKAHKRDFTLHQNIRGERKKHQKNSIMEDKDSRLSRNET